MAQGPGARIIGRGANIECSMDACQWARSDGVSTDQ